MLYYYYIEKVYKRHNTVCRIKHLQLKYKMENVKKRGNSRAVYEKIFEISRKNENKVCADCKNSEFV